MIRGVAEEIRRVQNELQPSMLGDPGIAATLDGQGFDSEERQQHPKGRGLSGMKGRAELSGGTLVVQAAPGKGTTLAFKWSRLP